MYAAALAAAIIVAASASCGKASMQFSVIPQLDFEPDLHSFNFQHVGCKKKIQCLSCCNKLVLGLGIRHFSRHRHIMEPDQCTKCLHLNIDMQISPSDCGGGCKKSEFGLTAII